MKIQLVTAQTVRREQFSMERFIGSDDIFALVKEGCFFAECEKQRFTVKEGEGFLFRRDVFYFRKVLSPVTLYLFRYKSLSHAFDRDHVIFRDQARLAGTVSMLERLDTEVFKEDFEYRGHLFADLVTQYAIENGGGQRTDEVIGEALSKINRRMRYRDIKLVEIAEQSGLSYVQFLRRFKQAVGIPPTEYIIKLRLQKAKALLIDTDLLVKEIAIACGFENEYYFSNFFKNAVGVSPSDFRRNGNITTRQTGGYDFREH